MTLVPEEKDTKESKKNAKNNKNKKEKVKESIEITKSAGGFFQGFAEKWAAAFAENTSLVHVDFSHN